MTLETLGIETMFLKELIKVTKQSAKACYEDELALQLQAHKVKFVREYKFSPERRFRADFYLLDTPVLIEVNGIFPMTSRTKQGGHQSWSGITRDYAKMAEAAILGYVTLCFTPEMVAKGVALEYILKIWQRYQGKHM